MDFDYDRLRQIIERRLDNEIEVKLDSGMMFDRIKYNDFSLSAGYAYTWVLVKNVIFCASGQAALAYKTSNGNTIGEKDGFSFSKVNLDGIGRFALVYNDTRWYLGMSAIFRTKNYHTSRFTANNMFGSINAYLGYNFILKKRYKKK